MGTHMKTTIELSDSLLIEAKQLARADKTTLREIVEAALRRELAGRSRPHKPFRLRDASVAGRGVQPGIDPSNWEQIRGLIYEGRGG